MHPFSCNHTVLICQLCSVVILDPTSVIDIFVSSLTKSTHLTSAFVPPSRPLYVFSAFIHRRFQNGGGCRCLGCLSRPHRILYIPHLFIHIYCKFVSASSSNFQNSTSCQGRVIRNLRRTMNPPPPLALRNRSARNPLFSVIHRFLNLLYT